MRTALKQKKIRSAPTILDVGAEATKEAVFLVLSALGDDMLRSMENFITAQHAWDKLREKYSGKTVTNELSVLNSLLHLKLMR